MLHFFVQTFTSTIQSPLQHKDPLGNVIITRNILWGEDLKLIDWDLDNQRPTDNAALGLVEKKRTNANKGLSAKQYVTPNPWTPKKLVSHFSKQFETHMKSIQENINTFHYLESVFDAENVQIKYLCNINCGQCLNESYLFC